MTKSMKTKPKVTTKLGRIKVSSKTASTIVFSKITPEYVEKLASALDEKPVRIKALKKVQVVFSGLVKQHASGKAHRVDGKGFNKLIQLCLQRFVPKLCKLLRVRYPLSNKRKDLPSSSRKWERAKNIVRNYLLSLLSLCEGISEPAVIGHLLRYFRTIYKLYLCFPQLCMRFTKMMISIWSQSESEQNRIGAFFCLHRLSYGDQEWNGVIIKRMFKAYLTNTKFTTIRSLAQINLMASCFVEICRVDCNLAYQQCFVYIRQLSIRLRAAIREENKEEAGQMICKWQYIHCLNLFCRVASEIDNEAIQLLLYPVVQVVVGTVRFLPAPRYYPLRFHCIRMLTRLCRSRDVYVPVLPMMLEILRVFDFNKKPKTLMTKKVNFEVTLKCRNEHMTDKSFYEELTNQIFESTMAYLTIYAHHISFPELVFPMKVSLQRVLKNCTNGQIRKIFKNLYDRIVENSKEIETRRRNVSLDVRDHEQMEQWERQSEANPPPLTVYFEKYSKLKSNTEDKLSTDVAIESQPDNSGESAKNMNGDNLSKDVSVSAVKKSRKRKQKEAIAELSASDSEDEVDYVGLSDLELNDNAEDEVESN